MIYFTFVWVIVEREQLFLWIQALKEVGCKLLVLKVNGVSVEGYHCIHKLFNEAAQRGFLRTQSFLQPADVQHVVLAVPGKNQHEQQNTCESPKVVKHDVFSYNFAHFLASIRVIGEFKLSLDSKRKACEVSCWKDADSNSVIHLNKVEAQDDY